MMHNIFVSVTNLNAGVWKRNIVELLNFYNENIRILKELFHINIIDDFRNINNEICKMWPTILDYLNEDRNSYSVVGYVEGITNANIQAYVNNLPVTHITNNAFYQCQTLLSVTIPNTIEVIGWGSFSECTLLSSVISNLLGTTIIVNKIDEIIIFI